MRRAGAPRALYALGALLVAYLAFPIVAFLVRSLTSRDAGWHDSGLFAALRVSAEGATVALLIGVAVGIPLAFLLARSRGRVAAACGVLVQLPLAVPPLISGILLIYVIGPYTFLGERSGQRLTQSMYGVIIAMTFVSIPFLVIAARGAFRAVDPALSEVAATLGHGPLSRFTRVEVPAAADGIRAGMVLMWLRAFGEYGTVVVLAYHPFTLPVYVENLFSSAPLSEAIAPTLLAFAIAVVAIVLGGLHRPRRPRRARLPAAVAPAPRETSPVGFAIDTAVGSFSLRVAHPAGSHRLAVLGPSGSGKSVTLRAIAGLLGRTAGSVSIAGAELSAAAPERRRIGYVPQGYGLMPGRTVWQQVTFGVDADPAVAAWWLRALRLDGFEDRVPDELSGGQRQRVSLARALASGPEVVLLDEPFSALDAPVRAELRREVRRLQTDAGLSTVLVTHDPVEAAMLADEVLVLSGGRVLQSGPCREVYRRPASIEVGRLLGIENLFAEPGALWQVPPEAVSVTATAAPEGRHGGTAAAVDPARDARTVDLGRGTVNDVIDLGRVVEVVVALPDGRELRARAPNDPGLAVGAACQAAAPADAVDRWAVTATR